MKNPKDHLKAFTDRMADEGLPSIVRETFAHHYREIVTGETGMISERDISPVSPDSLIRMADLEPYAPDGSRAIKKTVRIILNGGLGTGMGLKGPKSLLPVKDGKSFLEILLDQMAGVNASLALMNSFSTHNATLKALEALKPDRPPYLFFQHKYPKILQEDLSPALSPRHPEQEWNPPGHGDIYLALKTTGLLDRLLDAGIEYAFISNSDNLGATLSTPLLGYFAQKQLPFIMEVADRTPTDIKGGHLARHRDGRLLLRESAQCPENERDAFQDIERYRFFNTNNLWVNLVFLKSLIRREKLIRLPMIVNPKPLDPRDESSPSVYQVETAMGAAISLFEGAAAVRVPRSRFFPVKKCSDLLAVRSDYFYFADEGYPVLNPRRKTDALHIRLDDRFYRTIDQFDIRFPSVPSLVACESLEVDGDVRFEEGVVIRGNAVIRNTGAGQATVQAGTVVEGKLVLTD